MSRYLAITSLTALGVSLAAFWAADPSRAQGGVTPVTSGPVIRGITLPGAGNPGDKASYDCSNFLQEDVDGTGRMTDASVQCRPGGDVATTLVGIPARFNAFCIFADAGKLGGARLIQAAVTGNDNHCSLSAMTPQDAQKRFGGATWR